MITWPSWTSTTGTLRSCATESSALKAIKSFITCSATAVMRRLQVNWWVRRFTKEAGFDFPRLMQFSWDARWVEAFESSHEHSVEWLRGEQRKLQRIGRRHHQHTRTTTKRVGSFDSIDIRLLGHSKFFQDKSAGWPNRVRKLLQRSAKWRHPIKFHSGDPKSARWQWRRWSRIHSWEIAKAPSKPCEEVNQGLQRRPRGKIIMESFSQLLRFKVFFLSTARFAGQQDNKIRIEVSHLIRRLKIVAAIFLKKSRRPCGASIIFSLISRDLNYICLLKFHNVHAWNEIRKFPFCMQKIASIKAKSRLQSGFTEKNEKLFKSSTKIYPNKNLPAFNIFEFKSDTKQQRTILRFLQLTTSIDKIILI